MFFNLIIFPAPSSVFQTATRQFLIAIYLNWIWEHRRVLILANVNRYFGMNAPAKYGNCLLYKFVDSNLKSAFEILYHHDANSVDTPGIFGSFDEYMMLSASEFKSQSMLIYCDLVTLYGDEDLGQNCLPAPSYYINQYWHTIKG